MRYEYNLQQPGFTVENIDILNVSRGKNYSHSYRNGRIKHGFIYLIKGKMRYAFLDPSQEVVELYEGELLFIPQGSAYTGTYLEPDTEIKIVQFDLASGTLPSYLSKVKKIEIPNAGELIEAFFKPLKRNTVNHPFYYLSCLYALLWQMDALYSKIPGKYKKLQGALTELSERYEKNERISYYAALCDMSEVSFRRLFREYTGKSPIEYRNDVRLQNARMLLQSGEYNVSEAAETCGFSNLSFFIRLYKKKFGYTPKKE